MIRFVGLCVAVGTGWALATNRLDAGGLILGCLLGAIALVLTGANVQIRRDFDRVRSAVELAIISIGGVVRSAVRIGGMAVRPPTEARPGALAYQLSVNNANGASLLAFLVTLIPGVLVVGLSDDFATLFVVAADHREMPELQRRISERLEQRVVLLTA